MATGFDELGLETGARVAMVSHNAARLLVFLFGSSAFGRVGVPINFRLSAAEIQYILDHSGAEVLFIDPELADEAGLDPVFSEKFLRFVIDEVIRHHEQAGNGQ